MGYEIHISRAEEYDESEGQPITLPEWQSYADGNPALSVGGWLGWDEDRQPIYGYTCADGSPVSLTWFEGANRHQGPFRWRPLPRVRNFRRGLAGQSPRRRRRTVFFPVSD